ncbi:MAG TPA: A/G-specific adenine glycosylase [Thermoanaerobaculia bacterium]|nr:A/G-specific adenine glycosylase [Thermoanaerobaculia bacterium]
MSARSTSPTDIASATPAALLAWFDAHRRELPWRRDRDAYRIWVSEVMLQQTPVEAVLPYYERFLARFPDVAALAAAPVEEVLTLWSGLGYYRRARQLHAAARRIAEAGGFPRTVEGLRALPGIGEYTAAAVASQAFGVVVPVLDGNVERVLARRLAADGDPKAAPVRRRLRAAAAALLDPHRPGDSNQALMELGATLCVPRRPRCLLCPLRESDGGGRCAGFVAGDPERYPPPRRRRATQRQRRVAALVVRDGSVLLFRRPEDSELLAGTWELPWVEVDGGEEPAAPTGGGGRGADAASGEVAAGLARRYGGRWHLGAALGRVRHGITYRAIELEVRRAEVSGGGVAEEGDPVPGWFAPERLASLPLSSLVGKALRTAGALSFAANPGAG